jgi:ankyrin repeat protein
LFRAVEVEDLEMVELIVKKGGKVDLSNCLRYQSWLDYSSNNAIFQAIYQSNIEMVKLLICLGSDVNQKNEMQTLLMHSLTYCSDDAIPKYLIECNCDLGSTKDNTLLIQASKKGMLEVIEMLLDCGCPIDEIPTGPYYNGGNALMIAIRYGQNDVVDLLIHRGANLHAKDNFGNSASHLYSQFGTKTELSNFFMNGGSLEELKNDGKSAFDLALRHNPNPGVFGFLLLNSCLSSFDEKLLKGGNKETFEKFKKSYSYLIQQPNFDISSCSLAPKSILIMSIIYNRFDFFLQTISKVDVNEIEFNGKGALHLSIIYSRMDMFYFLIEKCPNLNFLSRDQNYLAIDFAIKKGNEEAMMKLCKIHKNIYPIDSNFFECSRIHQDLWFLLGRWKLFKSVQFCVDIHFKF